MRAEGCTPAAAAKRIAGAIDTTIARARALGTLQYFTPSTLFLEESFARAADTSPEQAVAAIAKARAGPHGARPQAREPHDEPRKIRDL